MKLEPFYTRTVPVCDLNGKQVDEIRLPEAIRPCFQRRGAFSDSGVYYKGSGVIYAGHLADRLLPGMLRTGESHCPYQEHQVIYPNLYGRYGIFLFRHQPVFRDLEGGCGPKEQNLPRMQKLFRFSAIEGEIETLPTPLKDHQIYVYRLKKLSGSYHDTVRLLEYVLAENFNCPWDKNLWGDICAYGYVRDLADWFISEETCHKLGTVYAFLNSIFAGDRYLYLYLTQKLAGLEQLELACIPFIAARILQKLCPGRMKGYDLENVTAGLYEKLLNLLYDGRACCHLEDEASAAGAGARDAFRKEIPDRAKAMERLLCLKIVQRAPV